MVGDREDFDGVLVMAKNEQGAILAVDAEAIDAFVFGLEKFDV